MKKLSRKAMLSRSFFLLLGSIVTPIKITFSSENIKNKYLTEGLELIHEIISRSLIISDKYLNNCIKNNEIDIKSNDGFKNYLNSFITVFNSHHKGEEEILFKIIEKKDKNVDFMLLKEQHKKLHPIIKKLYNQINISNHSISNYKKIKDLINQINILWLKHINEEEKQIELEIEPKLSLNEQLQLTEKLSKHGQSMSKPAHLILPFLIYNLERNKREKFTDDMPLILKNFLVPLVWKNKWKNMQPFLLD